MSRTLPRFLNDPVRTALEVEPCRRHLSAFNSFNAPPAQVSRPQLLVMLSTGVFAIGIVLTPALISQQQPRIISILANDLSESALSQIDIAQRHCKTATQSLKEKDYAISIEYADRPEVTQEGMVGDLSARSEDCDIHSDRIPPTLGKRRGTDLNALLEEVQTLLKSQRVRSNQNAGVITIWLQNAEPLPGKAVLNLKRVRSQLQQITHDRSIVRIFGPTGQLRSDLENAIQDNPQVALCSINDSENCVKQAFDQGRSLP